MRNLARLTCLTPVVAVLLTACSTSPASSSATASESPSTAASSSAAQTTPTAPTTPSTGTKLKAALITVVPAGFKLSKSGAADTGTQMQDEVNGPMKSKSHCADLAATAWIEVSGMYGVSFAQSDYLDGHDQEIAQEIDSFDSPTNAIRALSQLTAFMKMCKIFSDTSSKSITYRLAVSSVRSLGDGAVKGVVTSPRIQGGVIEVAAVKGNNVITVLFSATKLSTAQHATELVAKIQQNLSA